MSEETDELSQMFRAEVTGALDTLTGATAILASEPEAGASKQALWDVIRSMHMLSGCASSFGFDGVGSLASRFDRALRPFREASRLTCPELMSFLRTAVQVLPRLLEAGNGGLHATELEEQLDRYLVRQVG